MADITGKNRYDDTDRVGDFFRVDRDTDRRKHIAGQSHTDHPCLAKSDGIDQAKEKCGTMHFLRAVLEHEKARQDEGGHHSTEISRDHGHRKAHDAAKNNAAAEINQSGGTAG